MSVKVVNSGTGEKCTIDGNPINGELNLKKIKKMFNPIIISNYSSSSYCIYINNKIYRLSYYGLSCELYDDKNNKIFSETINNGSNYTFMQPLCVFNKYIIIIIGEDNKFIVYNTETNTKFNFISGTRLEDNRVYSTHNNQDIIYYNKDSLDGVYFYNVEKKTGPTKLIDKVTGYENEYANIIGFAKNNIYLYYSDIYKININTLVSTKLNPNITGFSIFTGLCIFELNNKNYLLGTINNHFKINILNDDGSITLIPREDILSEYINEINTYHYDNNDIIICNGNTVFKFKGDYYNIYEEV